MLKIPKVYVSYHIYLFHSKYAIRDFREVAMVNAKKIKKRYYIFLVVYLLIVPAVFFMFDNVVSADFTHKYKTILFVIKLFFMNLPILLALVINNYIDKKTKNVEK